jgi:hypothetical protein
MDESTYSSDKSSGRARQEAQQRVEEADAHGPILCWLMMGVSSMSLWGKYSNHEHLIAWAKTILSVNHQCVRDALAQLYTGSSSHPYSSLRHNRSRANHDHSTQQHRSPTQLAPTFPTRHS